MSWGGGNQRGASGRFPRIYGEGGSWGKQGFPHGSEPKASDAHPRAAATAAATSSSSSSRSVRQSSRQRPSRTTPITGGSASRSLGASSSSTAQAKLGSSVSGRA